MATKADLHIFVTGVVGRAMGSGSFKALDIQDLVDNARQAFINAFGEPEDPLTHKEPATSPIPMPALPEGMDFSVWRKDICSHWNASMRNATWEWLLETAKKPDGLQALTALKEMAASDVGDPTGKWYKANLRRVERAKAVLLML